MAITVLGAVAGCAGLWVRRLHRRDRDACRETAHLVPQLRATLELTVAVAGEVEAKPRDLLWIDRNLTPVCLGLKSLAEAVPEHARERAGLERVRSHVDGMRNWAMADPPDDQSEPAAEQRDAARRCAEAASALLRTLSER